MPLKRDLADITRISCHIGVYHDYRMLVIARVESPDMMGYSVQPCLHGYVWEEASGRVLLAFHRVYVRMQLLVCNMRTLLEGFGA